MTTKSRKIEKLEIYNHKYLVKDMRETELEVLVKKINKIIDHLNEGE